MFNNVKQPKVVGDNEKDRAELDFQQIEEDGEDENEEDEEIEGMGDDDDEDN